MGSSRARLIGAAALALGAIAPFAAAPATAAPAPKAAPAAAAEVRYTTVVAGGRNIFGMNLKPRAKVTDTLTGQPLEGVPVAFYPRVPDIIPHMCGGVTNAQGIATCGGVREQIYVFQARGYRVISGPKVVGDIIYAGSEDSVGLFGA